MGHLIRKSANTLIAGGIIALAFFAAVAALSPPTGCITRTSATEAKLQRLSSSLLSYRTLAGQFPTDAQGLKALVERPTIEPEPRHWQKLIDAVPRDAWDQEFHYKNSGSLDPTRPEVISMGPDGEFGTADDLSSQAQ